MPQLKQFKPEVQTKVLWLHHQAFSNSACGECKGACCERCGDAKGYLPYYDYNAGGAEREEWKALAKKYHFDEKLGFKTPTGCALPLTERSHTCLGFMCSGVGGQTGIHGWPSPHVNKPFTKEQREASHELGWLMQDSSNRIS